LQVAGAKKDEKYLKLKRPNSVVAVVVMPIHLPFDFVKFESPLVLDRKRP
jgi:hypothetical protein